MEKLLVKKSPPLMGIVKISGSKNSVLPILAASLLSDGKCIIKDVPCLSDVFIMEQILNDFGAFTRWDKSRSLFEIEAKNIKHKEASYDLITKMRASFLIAGPLLSRLKQIKIPLPGGCAIGTRPVELHLKGFAALGANIVQEHGFVEISATELVGNKIYLDFPSVGATENIIMASVLAKGQTVIENCAVEPEIVDLSMFLNSLGAQIKGAGTDTIKISGVESLKGGEYNVIPDRIEAGTFMTAAAITNGCVFLENIVWDHLKPVIAKLEEIGATINKTEKGMLVDASNISFKSVDIKTLPYPGFPTDMQAQIMSLLAVSNGTSVVTETLFENRFMHVGELKRMGANIKIESRSAIIEGTRNLTGSQVKATDLRAGAALILAGLCASGETEISDIHHIERGYVNIEEKLALLGAEIFKIS